MKELEKANNVFPWKKFRKSEFVVNCKTEEEAKDFLKELRKHNCNNWWSGRTIEVEQNNWQTYGANTCYRCNNVNSNNNEEKDFRLFFGNFFTYVEAGYKTIVEWSDYMFIQNKVKASEIKIIREDIQNKPYYSIEYYDTEIQKWCIGYSSFKLKTVLKSIKECFEIVEEQKEAIEQEQNKTDWFKLEYLKRLKVAGYNWIARDSFAEVCAFMVKPCKGDKLWRLGEEHVEILKEIVDFPEVQWEDKEPTSIDKLIEQEGGNKE